MGMFDDLVPGQQAQPDAAGGLFDDLIPASPAAAPTAVDNKKYPYSADNPPDGDNAFVKERKIVNGKEYRLHQPTGAIYGPDDRATDDPTVMAAFGKTKLSKRAQARADINKPQPDFSPTSILDNAISSIPGIGQQYGAAKWAIQTGKEIADTPQETTDALANAAQQPDQSSMATDWQAGTNNAKTAYLGQQIIGLRTELSNLTRTANERPDDPLIQQRLARTKDAYQRAFQMYDEASGQQFPQNPAFAALHDNSIPGTAAQKTAAALRADPWGVARTLTLQSGPVSIPSVAGGIIGSIAAGRAGAALGAGVPSAYIEAGLNLRDQIAARGADMNDPASRRATFEKYADEIIRDAQISGLIVGAGDAAGAAFGSGVAALKGEGTGNLVGKELVGTIADALFGAAGEGGKQVYNTGEISDPQSLIDEGLGEVVAGGVQQGGMMAVEGLKSASGKTDRQAPPPKGQRIEPRLFDDLVPNSQPVNDGGTIAETQQNRASDAKSDNLTETGQTVRLSEMDETDILRQTGYSLEQIADMNPAERAQAAQEARQQGVEPLGTIAPEAPAPGTSAPAPGFGTRKQRAPIQTEQDMAAVRPVVNAEPSEAQAAAGNYQKGHINLHGLDISIENPKGSVRRGRDEDGKDWASPNLPADYGYVKGTRGKDGDHVDVYIGPNPQSDRVYVIDQISLKDGKFDEHKAVLGASSPQEAVDLYANSFDVPTLDRIGDVTEMSIDEFKAWSKNGRATKRPVGNVQPVNPIREENSPRIVRPVGNVQPTGLTVPPRPQFAPVDTSQNDAADKAFDSFMASRKPITQEAFAAASGLDLKEAGRAIQRAALAGRVIQGRNGNWRRPPTRSTPIDALDFIASIGGIQDVTGELAGMNLPKMGPFGPPVRKNGLHPDKVREALVEAGYLRDAGRDTGGQAQTTVDDVYQLLDAHMRGRKTYSTPQDQAAADAIEVTKKNENANPDYVPIHPIAQRFGLETWAKLQAFFTEFGSYEEAWSQGEIADAARLVSEGWNADDAFERAAFLHVDAIADPEQDMDPDLTRLFANNRNFATVAVDHPPFPDTETPNAVQQPGPQEAGAGVRPAGDESSDASNQAEDAGPATQVPDVGESGSEAGIAVSEEVGADNLPQTVIPGAEAVSEADAAKAAKAEKARKELEARRKQSKLRKSGQESVEDQDGGLFGGKGPKQSSLLDAPEPQPETQAAFDAEKWNKDRADRIAASRAAGKTHLDKIEPAVETMRGLAIYNVHDPKERGVIRTVANTGEVVIHWSDAYSAKKNLATEKFERRGKRAVEVYESWLGPRDLKDYVADGMAARDNPSLSRKPKSATPSDATSQTEQAEAKPNSGSDKPNSVSIDDAFDSALDDVFGEASETTKQDFDPAAHVRLVADSIEDLRGIDVERLFGEAPQSADAFDDLRIYIIENRPELTSIVVKAIDDVGMPERGGKPTAAETQERNTQLRAKGQQIIDHVHAGNSVTLTTMTKAILINDPQFLKLGKDGLYIRSGSKWNYVLESQVDSLLTKIKPTAPAREIDDLQSLNVDAVESGNYNDWLVRHEQEFRAAILKARRDPEKISRHFVDGIEAALERAISKAPKTATAAATSAVKNTAMGLDDVAKGLSALFGGKNKLSSGFTFDEDTYAQALPFFKAGVAHFKDAGKDVVAMVRALVGHLAKAGMDRPAIENMRPYVARFLNRVEKGDVPSAPASSDTAAPPSAGHTFTTAETTHAKTGEPLFVATINTRVSPEEYARVLAVAKKHGGWYSSFKGRGAIPGFQFKSEDGRIQFLAEAGQRPQAPLSSRRLSSAANRPIFYSGLLRAVESLKQDKAPAAQWLGTIRNTPGVKPEEVAWLGLDDWLSAQTGTVTKAQIADFVRANQVQVSEVQKGGPVSAEDERWFQEYSARIAARDQTLTIDDANRSAEILLQQRDQGLRGTKFKTYQLPGGENYRELLLTLPSVDPGYRIGQDKGGFWRIIRANGTYAGIPYETRADAEAQAPAYAKAGDKENYRSGHWEEPNVVAHVRFNERTVDGQKVLFIEEIQSDWHQTGRKNGYRKSPAELNALKAQANDILQKSVDPYSKYVRVQLLENGKVDVDSVTTADITHWEKTGVITPAEANVLHAYEDAASSNGHTVPDAPFKTTWPELAMKRMVRWAAQNGFDRIAWTPGDVQADRYDLSKQISKVEFADNTSGGIGLPRMEGEPSRGTLTAYDLNGRVVIDRNMEPDQVEDHIGKDLAKRLFEQAPTRSSVAGLGVRMRKLSGLDLKVGGEGMRGFYDKILVDTARKLGKKFGASVGQITLSGSETKDNLAAKVYGRGETYRNLPSELKRKIDAMYMERGQPAHSLDITPAMRAAVMEGQPLFRLRPNKFRYAISDKQRRAVVADVQQAAQRILGHHLQKVTTALDLAPLGFSSDEDGVFDPNTGAIYIALQGAQDPRSTIRHEAIHALRQAGVFTKPEWAALSRMAVSQWIDQYNIRDRYESLYRERFDLTDAQIEELLIEEAVADAFADYMDNPVGEGVIARIFEKLRQFLESVRSMLKGQGFTKADQVFSNVDRGRMGTRAAGVGTSREFMLYGRQDSVGQDVTKTAAFKRWFGDSKVVDASGKPLVVYHGSPDARFMKTDAIFKSFNQRFGSTNEDGVHWFARDRRVATTYADDRRAFDYQAAEAGIIPAYLRMENPLIIDAQGKEWREAQQRGRTSDVIDQAKSNGHDGVIIRNVRDDYQSFGATGKRESPTDTYAVFSSTQIKGVNNSGAFDPKNPAILSSRGRQAPPRNPAQGSFEAPHDERVRKALFDSTDTLLSRIRRAAQAGGVEFRRKVQDREIDLLRTQGAITEAAGPIAEPQDAYLAASLYPGRVAQRDRDLVSDVIEPLVEDIARRGLTLDEVDQFNRARHAFERNLEIGKLYKPGQQFHDAMFNPSIVGGSGMSDDQASDILNAAQQSGKYADLEAVGDKIVSLNATTLDKLLAEGLIEQDYYDTLKAKYRYYVPLRGHEESADDTHPDSPRTGSRYDIRGKEFQQAYGRTSAADSTLAYSIMQARQAIIRIEKNRVGKRFLRLAQANPNEAFWQVNRKDMKKVIDKNTALVRNVYDPGTTQAENVYAVKVGGKAYHVTIHHEGLLKAMKGIGAENMHGLVLAFYKINRFLAGMNTSYDPEFIFRNLLRDLQQTGIVLQEEKIKGLTRNVVMSMPKAAAGMNAMLRGDTNTEWSRWARDYADAGGKMGFMGRNDIESEKASLEKLMKEQNPSASLKAWMVLRDEVAGRLDRYNDSIENTLRLATYVHMRKAGISKDKAAFAARELTVNFNRKGEWSSGINAFYMFFNAAMQGGASMAMRLARSKTVRRVAYGIMVTAFLQDMLNRMLAGDDDDGENRYDKIPDEIKAKNGIIMFPKWAEEKYGVPYLKWPLPLGYNMFHIAGTQAGHAVAGSRTPLEAAGETVGAVADAFNPLGGGGTILNFFAPTILDPAADIATNTDYFGENIMPRSYDDTQPNSDRYKPNVNPAAKFITDFLNEATGGSPERKGAIDWSPEWVEHIWDFAAGGVGRLISRTSTVADTLIKGDDLDANKVPFARVFTGQPNKFTDRDTYNEIKDAVHVTEKEIEARRAEGNTQEAERVAKKYAREVRMIEIMKTAEKQMTKLRKDYRAMKAMQGIGDAQRKERLDEISRRMDAIQLNVRQRWNSPAMTSTP